MNDASTVRPTGRSGTWRLVLAFLAVYISWGTTYLAIQVGVESFPPALFGGTRLATAGLLILGFLWLKGRPLQVPLIELLWTALVATLLFVGGNGLITVGEMYVASGVASVLVATTPLWLALLESIWPRGERLSLAGWFGLLAGLAGVVFLLLPRLQDPLALVQDTGPLLVIASAFCWAVGSFILRYRHLRMDHLTAAGYQLLLGGVMLTLIGLAIGESNKITAASFSPSAVYSFFHLLVFGSLVGYVAYNWLLKHVSATMAGTYAYVNPVVAILVGWLLNGEEITKWVLGGMLVILSGVALVRSSAVKRKPADLEVELRDADSGGIRGVSPKKRASMCGVGSENVD